MSSCTNSGAAHSSVTASPIRRIEVLAIFVLAGFAVAVAFHSVLGYLGFRFPWDTFLFTPDDRFNDWHNSVTAAKALNPYAANGPALSTYFPVSYLLFQVGAPLSRTGSLLIYLGISIGLLVVAIAMALRCQGAAIGLSLRQRFLVFWPLLFALLFSYPAIYALDRGNVDVWIASLCLIYVATSRTRFETIGFAALAVAIGMKGYPIAFLLLAVADRKYLAAFVCAAIAGLMSLLLLAVMWDGFSINLQGLQTNLQWYYRIYVLGPGSLFASADPYNGIRSLTLIFLSAWQQYIAPLTPAPDILKLSEAILRVYSLLSLAFAVTCSIFVLAVPAQRWRRVMAVCLLILVFPNVANDYKLTLIFSGVVALLMEPERLDRGGRIALTLLCLLLIPKSYFFAYGIGLTNLINPFLLIAMSLCVLADRSAWRRGMRLLRFRAIWHAALLGKDTWLLRALTSGRPAGFLRRDHKSMHLG